MLLALLLHLLIFQILSARDAPPKKDTGYTIRHIDTCPDVGYYFKRETSLNAIEPGPCYLCFCQGDNTAVCWKRDNRRCNVESFHYHGVGKRDTRIRRSPGFADIFFRDATRDVFNKNEKTQCKPFESSFSDDCPPADWCIGCTVCDCDANGRWDCHILSFCPDKKAKKKPKRKGPVRKVVAKKPVKKSTNNSRKNKKIPATAAKKIKPPAKAKTKTTAPIKRGGNSKGPPQKRIVKKSVPFMTPKPQKKKPPIRYKRISPTKPEASKSMIIKKNVATHKPIDIKSSKVNSEIEIAQKVMKKLMANFRKSINGEIVNMSKMANNVNQKKYAAKTKMKKTEKTGNKSKSNKKVNKRQVKKPQKKPLSRRYQKLVKKPTKKPPKKSTRYPTKKPTKKPARKEPPKKYVRHKRDLIMTGDTDIYTNIAQDIPSESTNTGETTFSITPVTSNLLSPDDDNCSHSLVRRSTIPENEYYKYFVGTQDPEIKIDMPMRGKETTQVNITETVLNLIGTEVPSYLSKEQKDDNDLVNKTTTLTEINAEANELKFSKWSHLKILKERKLKTVSEKYKSLVKIISPANKSIDIEDFKKKVHGKDIERKLNINKYHLVKLLNRPKCKLKNSSKNESTSNIQIATKKIGDLENLLNKLLVEIHNNNTSKPPKKIKKFSVIRYLKRIFNKIFRRKNTLNRFSQHHIIETLCDSFGPCKVSIKDKVLLKTKLSDLDAETTKILKTVKIIKGLLKLVDIPKTDELDLSTDEHFRNDIQKLNNILKGSYARNKATLSETQLTQIEYIKRNTQDFIQSVSKFATLLNEIIAILTKHDTNVSRKSNRILRNSLITKNLTKDNPFQSLKLLLVKYNLIQNSFMKRMYEQLNNFENKMNEKPKVSEVKDLNNSVAIESFSRNIIQNLRKLKRLAQTMSYSGRSKREALRDDDSIEYLLMLMEYLLKQNHPLDAAPVNDGIDLLIEAIKNAPDIKPIKKKVLEYTPATATFFDSTTATPTIFVSTEGSISDDDSPSDSDKTSSEDVGKTKLEDTEDTLKNKIEENKELAEMIAEDDKDPEDKYQYDRTVPLDKAEDITEIAFYNRVEDNAVLETENALETTTILPLEMEISDKVEKEDLNLDRPLVVENNNLDKAAGAGGMDDKKFEVFTGDIDEEVYLPSTVTVSESELPSTMTTEYTTQARKSRTKMRHLNLDSYDSESIDKKSKLEWIEENFGKDKEKDFAELEENNATSAVTVTPKTILAKTTDKMDVSILTREVVDETDKKRKAKINAEDVMLRKQMDLLNSLDYGTEKAEFEESDSKDGNTEDRYSSDTFPSYFV